ncbi:hypothetical protein C0993_008388, partial [Termitomyces sp. T159_Od127]
MYYDEKISHVVQAELPPGANSAECLAVIKRVTRQLWENETREVVEHVASRQAELKHEKDKKLANPPKLPSTEEILEHLENLPAFMGQFLEWLEVHTGWQFSCVMGGPDPSQDGDICVISYHVGKTPSGKDFAQSYRDFNKYVMAPYTDFLYSVFSSSELSVKPGEASDEISKVGNDIMQAKLGEKGKKAHTSTPEDRAEGSGMGERTASTTHSSPEPHVDIQSAA